MASFPDLRPHRRSAKAGSPAARRKRARVLLAVSAALLLTASLAVSELATLRGAKAHDASAFLTRELGPPLDSAPLVRTPARNVTVEVKPHGYRVTHGKTSLGLGSPLDGKTWRSYEHGVQRRTTVGHETILVDGESAEEFITVTSRQGRRTWRWRLDTKLHPRVTPKGFVGFFEGNRLSPLGIEPVAILDSQGRNVTPKGLRWSVAKRGKHTWLELALDDRKLEAPYTIDPTINFRAVGTIATSASGTSISVPIPAGAVAQDLLLMQVAVRSTTIPTTPGGWTLVANTNTANNNISQAVFWRKTASTDPGTNVSVTIPNAAAVGVINAYRGVDTSASPIQQTTTSNTSNSRNVTCPGLTTTAADETVVCHGSIATNGTWPASGGGYTQRVTGAQSTNISISVYDQNVPTLGTVVAPVTFNNVGASNSRNIANTFGLTVDTNAPTNGLISIGGVSPAGVAVVNGGTIYYRGSVAGQFQLNDAFTDSKSAPYSVTYPLVASLGWTHLSEVVLTAPNFTSSNYQWLAATTTPPTAAERTITETDAAGNTATQVVPIVNDTTGPTGQTITLTGTSGAPNYYNTNSVSFTLGDGADGGSGVDTATRTVTRETAPLSGDSCGTFTADAGTYTSPDTAVSSANCYRYTFTIKDRLGNISSGVTATAKVDGGNPTHGTIAISGVSPAGIAYLSGGTIYYRGSAAGQFQISDPATDTLTAAASVNYPLVSSAGWTHANETVTSGPNFTSSNYQWSSGTTTPPTAGERTLTAADKAANTSTLVVPVVNDTSAPTGQTISLTGTAGAPNYYNTNSVSFTIGDGSDPAGGAGLDTSTRAVARETAPLSGDSCGTFTADAGNYTSPDTSVSSGNCYRYTFTIKDNVGNTSSGVSVIAKVDSGNPTHGTIAISGVSPSGIAYLSGGGTIYYRGSAAGQFQISDPATDTLTAATSVNYPLVSSAGWTHANETVSSGPNFTSSNYSWSAGTTTPPTAAERTLTATDKATNTSTLVVPIVSDTTAPSVTGPTVAAGYYTSLSVPVTLNGGSDGGSGLAAGSSVVQRDEATLSGGSCGSFSGSWTTVTLSAGNDTTVQNGKCYQYREQLTDNVGNTGSSPASATAKVDSAGPSNSLTLTAVSPAGSTLKNGATIYYRGIESGGGSFKLRNAVSDPESSAVSSQTAALGGTSTGWTHTGSTVSTPAGGPYDSNDFTWAQGTTSSPTEVVTARDGADNATASATLTLTNDSNAPTGGAVTVNGTAASAGGTTSYDTDGSFTIGTRTDFGETQSGTESGLASSTLVRTSASFSAPDVCGSFGSPSTISGTPDQDGLTTGCYRYTLTGTDTVGNAVSISTTVKVDTSAPSSPSLTFANATGGAYYAGSGTRVFFRPDAANGGFDLTASSTDNETGVASYTFPAGASIGTNWSAAGSGATRTYSYTGTATTNGSANVTATNPAGGTSANGSFDVTADSSAPTGGAVTVNGTDATGGTSTSYDGDGSFPIDARTDYSETASATESGLASSTLVRTSATFSSADTCGSFGSPSTISGNPNQSGLSTGCYKYTLTGTDNVGNTVSISTIVKVDTDNPSVSLTDPGSPVAGAITLAATASDATTDVAQVVFERAPAGGSTWTTIGTDTTAPYTANWNTTAVVDGLYDLRAVATDKANNSNTSLVANRRVDNTAPDTTIDSTPPNPSNDTTPTFAFSSTEPGSTFECRVDGGSWASCPSPETLAALGAGSHTFDVRATDPAGNTDGSPASHTWTIDLSAPNTTIDSNPPSVDNDTTPTFTFSSSESGSTFECRIDGGSWATCSSPHTVSPALTEGSHTFDVRATNAVGNTDATPASYTWTVDLGPPTVTITAPTTYVNGSDPSTYPVNASTPDTDVTRIDFFECSNASTDCATGTWTQFGTDGTSPYSADWSTPGADGTRGIRALAIDAAANTGEHVRTITIDRTAPSGVTVSYPDGYVFGSFAITTDNGPDSDVNASSGVLERRLGDLANNSCSSYAGWAAAASPDTIASTKCAQYRYRVADNAGNWTTATSSNEVKSDTDAPTSIQADPGANLRQTVNLTAVASDTGGSTLASVAFQRRPASGGSWTTIATDTTSPYSASFDTTSVADGLYDFRSMATDVAGNVETSPAVLANKRIDNTAPSATMLSPGNPVSGTVTLTSNTSDTGGSGIATVAYELAPSGGSFNSQPASWDTTLVADGLYDLHVIATDVAGNSTTSALITTRVDNTPPAVTFSSPAAGAIVSGTVNLVASASDASPASPPVSFAYKLASDPPSAYTATGASWDTTALPGGDGLYDLRAQATDDAGNIRTVEHANLRADNVAPSVAITAPPAAINGSVPSPTTFSANATDPGGSGVAQVQFFECSNQSADCATGVWSPLGTVAAPGPYSVSWTIPGTDGNHALAAVATDNAGHPTSAIRNVDVDRNAPNTAIVTKPADPSNDVTPTFTFTSSETGSTFECSVDGGSFAPCTSPHNVAGLTDNAHTFDVRATDPAGNTDATPATWTWQRDTNSPTGTLNNPGANIRQTVTLTSSESDPASNGYASGLASVTYEYSADGTTWALIGMLSSAPFDSMIWNTTPIADGVYQLHVVVRDVAGNVTNSAPVTNVRIDNTPPTTSQDDPGQYLRATKTLTASAADSGSGIDHVDVERAPTGGGSWTLVATDSTPGDGFAVSFDTTTVADGHYDFRTVAYDVAGNQAAATPVTDRLVDNTPPSATINSPGGYMRGAVNLTSSTSDPGGSNASGVVSVAYEYSTNGGSSWQPTGSSFDTTAVPDGNVDLHVIATDAAGNSTTSPSVTSLVDNTKPATSDNAPGGWQSSTVTVTLTPNDAGGSGVNVTEYSVDGDPTYTVGTSVIIPAPANGSNDGAHTIAYFSVDNAGNIETVKSTTVLIDATPPACPSCSAADYLRGTVTLSASPTESGSGIQSVTFEYTDAGGSSWTTIGTDTTGPAPYTVDWDTVPVPDGHYDLRISVTDNANNVTTTNLPDKVVDNTAPDVATVGAPTEGQLVTGTVAIAASASDVTSPIASVRFYVRGSLLGTDTTAPFSMNWDTTTGADGAATIQVVVEDMAGNSTSSAIRNVSVDNVSPTPTLADPGQFLSGTVSLSASSDGDTTQVDFERRPAGGGAWVTISSDTTLPWGTSLDTTALADGLYDFRAVATDQSGNTGASPIRSNVRIDNTNPAGSITTPANGATVGGSSVALGGSYSDGGSGVASVQYDLRPTGGGSWSAIATSTSAPFGATWDATTVPNGSYDLRPVITDRAGNTFTGATITITVDVTAPTVVLTNPGATIAGVVTLNATVSGSGASQVAFSSTPTGGAAWTSIGTDTTSPWSTGFDTSKLSDGVYDLRAVVSDSLGNTSNDVVAGIRIDNTAPRVISSTPAEGSTITSASSIALVTSESATPVGVTLDGGSTVAPVISGTSITYNTGALAVGPHTLAGELQDSSGKKEPFRVHFTVWSSSGPLAPYVEKNTNAGSSTTVDSADGFASATMPEGAWSTAGADWIVIRIAPMPAPTGLTNGFAAGPEALDVTARWALAGTEVHQFSQPVGILIRSTEKGLVPATFENGNWRVIARVPTAGILPAGWEDGFWSDASGFHVMTKHLSLFALLHDVQAPQPPQNIRGFLGSGGLTIRWTAGADNSGTYDFVTVFSDSNDVGHYGVDYIAASIGAWAPGDPRVFRLKETDLAGNESTLTRPLILVPSLVGKTPDEAVAQLAARGFTLGTLTPGGTGKAGTITGPEGLALAEEGAAIDVTVAPGFSAFSRLVFKIHTAPKFKPSVRKKIAARVSVTRAARVTAELFSPRRVKIYTWRFSVKAGRSIVKLNIPRQVRRPGIYSMRWTAKAGRDTVSSRIKIRMVGTRGTVVKAAEPIEVVLAGDAPRGARSKLPKRKPLVVTATGIEPTFDEAASRKTDTRVIVVDADEFGVAFIRDLHTVFPSVKIIALSSSPRTMTRALKAGAVIVLPRSTPPATLARVIQRLLAPPKPANVGSASSGPRPKTN